MRVVDTASSSVVKSVLSELQTVPNRVLGQNFLVNPMILDRIVETANIELGDSVLEIGPGLGALTMRLANHAERVTTIEKDHTLAQWLQHQGWALAANARIIDGDALDISWQETQLPNRDVKLVANLPYAVSKPLLRRILETWRPHLRSATVMVQKEVALRLTANPGGKDWGPMGIMAQLYSDAKRCFNVAPGSFVPAPSVTSTVVHLQLSQNPRIELSDEKYFWHVVRASFSKRRKQLANSLLPFTENKDILAAKLNACNINPSRRPETLSVEEFARIAEELQK